jgi:hypothetical protein
MTRWSTLVLASDCSCFEDHALRDCDSSMMSSNGPQPAVPSNLTFMDATTDRKAFAVA